MRFFRLNDGGVQCDEDGLFVGSVPMLLRSPRAGSSETWAVRPTDELDRDLGACYGLPIDVASKRDGLAGVARALERGDMAFAKIAAVLLGFPDPPALAKDAPTSGSLELAAHLFWSDLLKGGWDPAKHPRTGEPPNPGQFAPTEGKRELSVESKPKPPIGGEPEPEPSPGAQPTPGPSNPRGPWRNWVKSLRAILKADAVAIAATEQFGQWAAWAASSIKDTVETDIAVLVATSPPNFTQAALRAIEQARASLDPPKTLVELQTPPTQNAHGYELHHIVEQNKDNIVKTPLELLLEKFGRNLIDSPSNLVWVPRLKHELITGYYNSKVDGGLLRRQVVNQGDFASQREAGLQALRRFGVLQ